MTDDLMIPTVPEPRAEDSEDVSWALSTAEAVWARGEHAEGIKWVRRAAEHASEAENDHRALELAKAAADLTTLIARRNSRASIDLEEVEPISEPAPPPVPPRAPPTRAPKPVTAEIPSVRSPGPQSITKQVTTPSRPPAPLPSRSQRPPAAKPLGTNTRPPSQRPGARKTRKSRENLDLEAAAAALAPAPLPSTSSLRDTPSSEDIDAGFNSAPLRAAAADPTFVGRVENTHKGSAAEWDTAATQNLTGDELPFPHEHAAPPAPSSGHLTDDGDRMTAIGAPPAAGHGLFLPTPASPSAPVTGSSPPATVAASLLATGVHAAIDPRAAAAALAAPSNRPSEPHDPGITTSQAVRVVVWRDGNGVHVAPRGTVVSAITVDAVLVALEPGADLTAWLSDDKRRP